MRRNEVTFHTKINLSTVFFIMKKEYLSLKALLNVIGVNLIDIDLMKE